MLALLAQLASVEGDVRANAERAAAALAEHPEADIAVFPELFLSGYTTSELEALTRRVVYANAVGNLHGLTFVGGSRSIAPSGNILAEAAEAEERLLLAPIGLGEYIDDRVDYLRQLPGKLEVATL